MNKEYIERDAVLQNFKEVKPVNWDNTEYEKQAITDYNFYRSIVENAPVVDVAPVRHGHWIHIRDLPYDAVTCECSRCTNYTNFSKDHPSNFCPTCGADMRGEN